ncbi:uncharacterized protein LOC128963502 [Oppia nitens]|uniref:uncharacterized protein LOC128963502 n=1 Tax=Oppia nitens TaxID=1686743 RepID=UPI0023DBAE65|nr:uncharacterized protein LOC128963502 [Oppia nitens]
MPLLSSDRVSTIDGQLSINSPNQSNHSDLNFGHTLNNILDLLKTFRQLNLFNSTMTTTTTTTTTSDEDSDLMPQTVISDMEVNDTDDNDVNEKVLVDTSNQFDEVTSGNGNGSYLSAPVVNDVDNQSTLVDTHQVLTTTTYKRQLTNSNDNIDNKKSTHNMD